jgi:hypothetical protein
MLCCEVGKAPSIGRKESGASIPQIQRRHALNVTGVNAPIDPLQGRLLQILAPHLGELANPDRQAFPFMRRAACARGFLLAAGMRLTLSTPDTQRIKMSRYRRTRMGNFFRVFWPRLQFIQSNLRT